MFNQVLGGTWFYQNYQINRDRLLCEYFHTTNHNPVIG